MFSAIAALSTCAIAIASGDSNTCDEGTMLQVQMANVRKQASQEAGNLTEANPREISPCTDYQVAGPNPTTGNLRTLHRYNKILADGSRCDHREDDVELVYTQEECEALAVERCHGFYSYRHNERKRRQQRRNPRGGRGQNKCITTDICNPPDMVGTATEEWNIYATPFDLVVQEATYRGCYTDRGTGHGQHWDDMATYDDRGDTFVNCMSFCVTKGFPFMSLNNGGARCYCHRSVDFAEREAVDGSACDGQGNVCTSDNTFKCGGRGVNAIYAFTPR